MSEIETFDMTETGNTTWCGVSVIKGQVVGSMAMLWWFSSIVFLGPTIPNNPPRTGQTNPNNPPKNKYGSFFHHSTQIFDFWLPAVRGYRIKAFLRIH